MGLRTVMLAGLIVLAGAAAVTARAPARPLLIPHAVEGFTDRPSAVTKIASLDAAWGEKKSTTARS